MLHFFKKTGRTVENEEKVPDDVKEKELSLSSSSSTSFDIILDEEIIIDDGKEFVESRSKLSKNLLEIISDKNCICYFVQFLETKCALSLIKFYLDAENFKTVAEFSLNNKKLKENKENNLKNEKTKILTNEGNRNNSADNETLFSDEKCDNNKTFLNQTNSLMKKLTTKAKNDDNVHEKMIDQNVIESVPELKSLCDLSMQRSLTDDEKSRLYAETNKQTRSQPQHHKKTQFQNDNEGVENVHSSKLDECTNIFDCSSTASIKVNTSIATDAFRIYKKYLTLNSQYFIDIPATILSSISLALCTQQTSVQNSDKISNSNTGASNCSSVLYENTLQPSSKMYISSNCFEEAKRYVYDRMEKEYLNEFLVSDFFCKYCLDILISPDLQLFDILYNESTLFYFMEYLEQINQRNYLEFWIVAINFRKQYYQCNDDNIDRKDDDNDDVDDDDENIGGENVSITSNTEKLKEAQSDAMILYEKYFSLQAKNRLKISDNVRSKIEENICSNNSVTISKCFDLPLKIIENHFEKNCFGNFIKSPLFMSYLNELRNRLKDIKFSNRPTRKLSLNKSNKQQQQQYNYRGHRKTMSDCTNETTNNIRSENNDDNNFISQHNTLLAMESHTNKLKKNNIYKTGMSMVQSSASQSASDCMQIDTRYLTNPDLLWHRNLSRNNSNSINGSTSSSSGLTFGRVDSLGRYERDFDLMEIDNKWSLATGGSKIKNAVRKLVNLPEEKVQEEIAWQVAELIVKDITSITLGNNNYHDNYNNENITINDDKNINNTIDDDASNG